MGDVYHELSIIQKKQMKFALLLKNAAKNAEKNDSSRESAEKWSGELNLTEENSMENGDISRGIFHRISAEDLLKMFTSVLNPVQKLLDQYYDFAYGNRTMVYNDTSLSYTRRIYSYFESLIVNWFKLVQSFLPHWKLSIGIGAMIGFLWRVLYVRWRFNRGEIQANVSRLPTYVKENESSLENHLRMKQQRRNGIPKFQRSFFDYFPSSQERRQDLEIDQQGRLIRLRQPSFT